MRGKSATNRLCLLIDASSCDKFMYVGDHSDFTEFVLGLNRLVKGDVESKIEFLFSGMVVVGVRQ